MATLEKIRSKSVLLFVIIIVALLAFILGDFLTSGRTYFGGGTTMAKAGTAKVDYHEYQNRMNAVSEQQRNQQQSPDNDELSQQVLQEILLEQMQKQEYEKLGLTVTDSELTEALTGATPHPAAQQFIYTMSQQLGLPTPSGQAVFDAINQPQRYGLPAEAGQQLKAYWAALESQVETAMLQEKYARLISGLFTANELDAQSAYDNVNTTRHIAYVSKPLSAIADDQIELSDADLKKAWEEKKAYYRLTEPVRTVDYIMVNIEPSQADLLAGQKEVEDAVLALNSQEGTGAVSSNARFIVNNASATRSQINDNRLKNFVDSANVGEAVMLSQVGNRYNIVKLLGKTQAIDSINVSMLGSANPENLDSLLAEVKAGKTFAELADGSAVQSQDSLWTSLAVPGIPENLKAAMETEAVGQAFLFTDSINGGAAIYRINKRHSPVTVYELASIDYTVDPSNETLAQLSADLNTFVSNNSSAADFAANAAEAGYTILPAVVSNSSAHVGNAPDSRSVVKWIMNAKKGQVMPVYQDNKQTYMLTAALKNIYDGEYLPYNAEPIADRVKGEALKAKKAEKLIAQYQGKAKDLAGYAQLMNAEQTTTDAVFGAPMLGSIGYNESALQGAIASAKQGQIVGPVEGNNAVVVFVVNGEDKGQREFTFQEYANQFNRTMGIGGSRPLENYQLFQLLLGDQKVDNRSLDFIQGFGE